MRLTAIFFLLGIALPAEADVFTDAATRHGVNDPELLRAIAKQESSHNPWALNINGVSCQDLNNDGDPFLVNGRWRYCDSRATSIAILLYASKNPWLITADGPKGKRLRIFMPSQERANVLVKRNGLRNASIERKNVQSTDIGLMQINWRSHGENIQDASKLFDPAYNVDYGAQYLAGLIRRHGKERAMGMYHTGERGSPGRQETYRNQVLRHYASFSK